ncbi:MAG: 16S rRNA (adenine(1518)-N(6)/adenine(1519)-N(6))-dimethyltransferase RsmA [Phycisphaerae bacterium]
MPETSPFQTKAVIRDLLTRAGLHPHKRLGQCFLIDRNLMNKLLESAELTPADCVLEVGCGTGSLTGLLAERVARVITVELDPRLASIARERLARHPNVRLLNQDVLANKSTVAPEIEAAVDEAVRHTAGRILLVANLPYDIATPLIVNLLLGPLPVRRFCFSVQREVADRFLAGPGTPDYGPVSIVSQSLVSGRRIARLPPQAFWPVPKVASSILRLDTLPPERIESHDPADFARFVRSCFRYRRKTISHIARMLNLDVRILPTLSGCEVSPDARPQDIRVDQWIRLHEAAG